MLIMLPILPIRRKVGTAAGHPVPVYGSRPTKDTVTQLKTTQVLAHPRVIHAFLRLCNLSVAFYSFGFLRS